MTFEACITGKAGRGVVGQADAKRAKDRFAEFVDDYQERGQSFREAKRKAAQRLQAEVERDLRRKKRMRLRQSEIERGIRARVSYLVTEWGRPYASPKAFANRFKSWCRQAGLPHCTAHGLRKAGATRAANNHATEYQLMAMYGWDSPKQAALYTRKANRKRLAAEAMHKLIPDQIENESVPPESALEAGGTMRGKLS